MSKLKRLVLDVLKPHQPDPVEFALAIAAPGEAGRIKLTVTEVDEKTQSIIVVIDGDDIDLAAIKTNITRLGASLHSIDEVEVSIDPPATG